MVRYGIVAFNVPFDTSTVSNILARFCLYLMYSITTYITIILCVKYNHNSAQFWQQLDR